MIDGERIVAAAVLHRGLTLSVPTPGRHHDVLHLMAELYVHQDGTTEQGFITSTGRFVRRRPALVIAERAGQLNVVRPKSPPEDTLFSEDLW